MLLGAEAVKLAVGCSSVSTGCPQVAIFPDVHQLLLTDTQAGFAADGLIVPMCVLRTLTNQWARVHGSW